MEPNPNALQTPDLPNAPSDASSGHAEPVLLEENAGTCTPASAPSNLVPVAPGTAYTPYPMAQASPSYPPAQGLPCLSRLSARVCAAGAAPCAG